MIYFFSMNNFAYSDLLVNLKLRIMRSIVILFAFLFFVIGSATGKNEVVNLLTENRKNPIGIDRTIPRFSWQIISDERGVMQSAYEIRVSEEQFNLEDTNSLFWNSGKVESDQSVHISYTGKGLGSGKRYYWQVRIWDQNGKQTNWSEPAFFQMGLLKTSDWRAKWIRSKKEGNTTASPLFRKEFQLPEKIKSATLFITSYGVYEAFLNGKRIGIDYMTPGWTSYSKRLQYQVYDLTEMVSQGKNAIGVHLGNGWHSSILGWADNTKGFYDNKRSVLAQIEINYEDGSQEIIRSNSNWKTKLGPVRYSEIYHGETYDARLEVPGWSNIGFDDSGWEDVVVEDYPKDHLLATWNEPVRKKETLPALELIITPEGDQVIDFGQNLVGWVTMKVKGKAGDTVKVFHTEVLDKEGNFYTESLRSARQLNSYVLKGKGQEVYEPHFTWQGFRYIKIVGYPGDIELEDFTATALYSDMEVTGTFACSNELINQLQHNIQWGQRGNFLDVPTDCPQRDERLGWTGDAQAFARTASFNFNVNSFFAKWLRDLEADQVEGNVPAVVPDVLEQMFGSPGWADAATIVPWTMYIAYGDQRILEDQYNSMKAWVDYVTRQSKDYLWIPAFSFGDWLFYSLTDDTSGKSAITDKSLIGQCFYAHSIQNLIHAAKVLNKTDDIENYTDLLEKVKEAFVHEYMTSSGRLVSGTQTAYVLALHFDMLPERLRAQAAKRLVDNIRAYNTHLTTGFLGTPYLCHVLSRFGYTDVAYELLLQKTYPSWLYPVTMGATTIWERWDGIKPDGSFQNPGMNSFNHYAYGAIGDWMYRVVTGIDTFEDAPGYKKIKIKPHIGGDLTYAGSRLKTYYGEVFSSWKIENEQLIFDFEIPVNTTAEVFIPADHPKAVTEGGSALDEVEGISFLGDEDDFIKISLGSGKYRFKVEQ